VCTLDTKGKEAEYLKELIEASRGHRPQVVAPCGFEMISCGPLDRRDRGDPLWTSRRLAERKIFIPAAFRVQG
jgi:hypothetical protein